MQPLLLAGLGGFCGSVMRFLCVEACVGSLGSSASGILLVNALGSLAAGFILPFVNLSPETRLFLITGFLGGFTTFSAFSMVVLEKLNTARAAETALLIFIHVFVPLALALLGLQLGNHFRTSH